MVPPSNDVRVQIQVQPEDGHVLCYGYAGRDWEFLVIVTIGCFFVVFIMVTACGVGSTERVLLFPASWSFFLLCFSSCIIQYPSLVIKISLPSPVQFQFPSQIPAPDKWRRYSQLYSGSWPTSCSMQLSRYQLGPSPDWGYFHILSRNDYSWSALVAITEVVWLVRVNHNRGGPSQKLCRAIKPHAQPNSSPFPLHLVHTLSIPPPPLHHHSNTPYSPAQKFLSMPSSSPPPDPYTPGKPHSHALGLRKILYTRRLVRYNGKCEV